MPQTTVCVEWVWNKTSAAIAQLGERQTEDLKVPGSILGLGTIVVILFIATVMMAEINFIA